MDVMFGLEIHFEPGPPVNIDPVIAGPEVAASNAAALARAIRINLTGVTYDERIGFATAHAFFGGKGNPPWPIPTPKLPGSHFFKKDETIRQKIQGILSVSANHTVNHFQYKSC